jgi:hypothetical protein
MKTQVLVLSSCYLARRGSHSARLQAPAQSPGTVKDPSGGLCKERRLAGLCGGLCQPGHYEVGASSAGFDKILRKNLTLHFGQTLTLNFALAVQTTSDAVPVTGRHRGHRKDRNFPSGEHRLGGKSSARRTALGNVLCNSRLMSLPMAEADWFRIEEPRVCITACQWTAPVIIRLSNSNLSGARQLEISARFSF